MVMVDTGYGVSSGPSVNVFGSGVLCVMACGSSARCLFLLLLLASCLWRGKNDRKSKMKMHSFSGADSRILCGVRHSSPRKEEHVR